MSDTLDLNFLMKMIIMIFGVPAAIGFPILYLSMKKIEEDIFRKQYRDALDEFNPQRNSLSCAGNIGALTRIYWNRIKEAYVDDRKKIVDVKFLGSEPLNVYYGGGNYTKSDIIGQLVKHARKYGSNAYSLSDNTLYVHRDTVLAVNFFKRLEERL